MAAARANAGIANNFNAFRQFSDKFVIREQHEFGDQHIGRQFERVRSRTAFQ
jgi:hypothetical protein